jgi:hypothetical protein
MPKSRKRKTHDFSVQPEGYSGGVCPFILLEEFQPAVRLNAGPSIKFQVEFVVKKVPLQQAFSECFHLHLSVSFQHAPYSPIYHQRYIAPGSAFK